MSSGKPPIRPQTHQRTPTSTSRPSSYRPGRIGRIVGITFSGIGLFLCLGLPAIVVVSGFGVLSFDATQPHHGFLQLMGVVGLGFVWVVGSMIAVVFAVLGVIISIISAIVLGATQTTPQNPFVSFIRRTGFAWLALLLSVALPYGTLRLAYAAANHSATAQIPAPTPQPEPVEHGENIGDGAHSPPNSDPTAPDWVEHQKAGAEGMKTALADSTWKIGKVKITLKADGSTHGQFERERNSRWEITGERSIAIIHNLDDVKYLDIKFEEDFLHGNAVWKSGTERIANRLGTMP